MIKFKVENAESNDFIAIEEIENGKWITSYDESESPYSPKVEFNGVIKSDSPIRRRQFTGLCDNCCTEIYDGDILSEWVETEERTKQSFKQVYWDKKEGCWMLDHSYSQDKSNGTMLGFELKEYEYKVTGNIHKNPELLLT